MTPAAMPRNNRIAWPGAGEHGYAQISSINSEKPAAGATRAGFVF